MLKKYYSGEVIKEGLVEKMTFEQRSDYSELASHGKTLRKTIADRENNECQWLAVGTQMPSRKV